MARRDRRQQDEASIEEAPSMEHPKAELSWPDFDNFWFWAKSKYSLKEGLKSALKKYFEAKNIQDPSKYEEGLKKFGIK